MDYSQFRSSSGQGAAVGVNHRALITRALTKYPVDYALYRELLQNSADARAGSAVIQLETNRSDISGSQLHDAPITRLRFSNDGLDFAADDWARLREIASGNPNETKIGAFGVGFYSVFELTDEPLVHSGNQIMAFKYHGVQLHYYFKDDAPAYQKGTLIDLPYREEQSLPDLVKFIGFLVQSFILVDLNEIRFELKHGNQVTNLLHLTKHVAKPQVLAFPPSFHAKSPNRTLSMASLEQRAVKISIKYLNASQMPPLSMSKGFFSFGKQLVKTLVTTSEDPNEYTTLQCDLTKADAFVNVSVSSAFRKRMVETLLKPPPKQAVMSLISFPGMQYLPPKSQLTSYIFPNDYNDAKVFIGFATKQSTGFKSHLALNQVIPTMERTAVDMSNQFVKDWNTEMLYMGGVMARCVYEFELSKFQSAGAKGMEDALFVCSRFRFGKSAPDSVIGLCIREGFWKCSQETLVPTTQGILPSYKSRLPGNAAEILRSTPIVTENDLAHELEKLRYVKPISLSEICGDIAASPLSRHMFVKVVEWLVEKWPHMSASDRAQFLTATTVQYSDSQTYTLGAVSSYHDKTVNAEEEFALTIPPQCLPFDLAWDTNLQNLQILGLHALRLSEWVDSRVQHFNEVKSVEQEKVARDILYVASRTWPRLSSSDRKAVVIMLNSVRSIPTQKGMKYPAESYIQEIKLFPDSPVVSPHLDVPSKWLLNIGVRQSMNMEFVLQALSSHDLNWTNEDLVQYLSENQNMLKQADWKVLTEGAFFTKHGDKSGNHYTARDLYAPQEQLAQLGLPILEYPSWSDTSKHAHLLFGIGLKRYPAAKVLFRSDNKASALHYFVTHFEQARYSVKDVMDIEIIPTLRRGVFVKPSECYRDTELEYFGEHVISHKFEAYSKKLGVRERPPIEYLVRRVIRERESFLSNASQCNKVFSYFSRFIGEFDEATVAMCKNSSFIPMFNKDGSVKTWNTPNSVFLPSERDDDQDVLRPLLQTIHPSQGAVPFLHVIGVWDKPSLPQIVTIMIEKSAKVFEVLGNTDTYKEILVSIESHWKKLERHPRLIEQMKRAPVLLGIKYPRSEKQEANIKGEVSLYSAANLAIVDDVIVFNQFRDYVVTAPDDDAIQHLYRRLGVRYLTETLRETIKIGTPIENLEKNVELEKRINERLRLFLDNTSKQKKQLSVSVGISLVKSLELRRDLPPYASITISKSAFMNPNGSKNLLVVPGSSFEWIDVAVALSKAFLVKPDQDSFVVLETQLSSDLLSLEKKGYNVQKLRQQGLNDLGRKKPAFQIQEDVDPSSTQRASLPHKTEDRKPKAQEQPVQAPMPGAWPTSDKKPFERPPAPTPMTPLPSSSNMPNSLSKPPQPSSNSISQDQNSTRKKGLFSQVKDFIPQSLVTRTATPQKVDARLNAALQKGLSYDSSRLLAPQHVDEPPPLPRSEGGCTNSQKIHDLRMAEQLVNGVKVFVTKEAAEPMQDELVLSETLVLLCAVFGYSPAAIHLYRDNDTSTIAFNRNGSLFFNSCVKPNTPLPLDYYYPVMAHELAHNLVLSHGAAHSFYAEAYVQSTLAKFSDIRSR